MPKYDTPEINYRKRLILRSGWFYRLSKGAKQIGPFATEALAKDAAFEARYYQ